MDTKYHLVSFKILICFGFFSPAQGCYFHRIMSFYNTDRSSIYEASIETHTQDLC